MKFPMGYAETPEQFVLELETESKNRVMAGLEGSDYTGKSRMVQPEDVLTQREKDVWLRRSSGETLKEIAAVYRVSAPRIRQVYLRAQKRMNWFLRHHESQGVWSVNPYFSEHT